MATTGRYRCTHSLQQQAGDFIVGTHTRCDRVPTTRTSTDRVVHTAAVMTPVSTLQSHSVRCDNKGEMIALELNDRTVEGKLDRRTLEQQPVPGRVVDRL